MLKFMKNAMFLIIFVISGCAQLSPPPTPEEVAAADCGPYPDDYEKIIKEYMVTLLLDSYSAQYHYQGLPKKDGATLLGGTKVFGWGGLVYVNAKNRMGGYVGAKTYAYMIRDNKVIVMNPVIIFGHPY